MQFAAKTAGVSRAMIGPLPHNLRGLRGRDISLLGSVSGLRWSEIVFLDHRGITRWMAAAGAERSYALNVN